ncbi:hypothetical protein PRIO_5789 [Paenibacillus riograndensis SBR5]|uniref:Uncharacterized protein n=1 Tax=Paenibacillus riograndensis SBR5 TaxID=1073571 RepID=A0A0E4CZ60_9BACL|nr:hypothetical protein PRIO_5789 [Paenibacillus riograndensis SBR5]
MLTVPALIGDLSKLVLSRSPLKQFLKQESLAAGCKEGDFFAHDNSLTNRHFLALL